MIIHLHPLLIHCLSPLTFLYHEQKGVWRWWESMLVLSGMVWIVSPLFVFLSQIPHLPPPWAKMCLKMVSKGIVRDYVFIVCLLVPFCWLWWVKLERINTEKVHRGHAASSPNISTDCALTGVMRLRPLTFELIVLSQGSCGFVP